MTDAALPWVTPTVEDLGPVSHAQLNGGPGGDSSTMSVTSIP